MAFYKKYQLKDEKIEEILTNIYAIHDQDDVVEVRILKTPKGTVSGYYDDLSLIPDDIEPYVGKFDIYFTLNPVNPSLLARCCNRLQIYAKQTTADNDIAKLTNVLIDFDPLRAAGISSTKAEKSAAWNLLKSARNYLTELGFPQPIICDSGNGYHLIYNVEFDNDPSNVDLIKRFLAALDFQFSNEQAEVDRTTYNPSRIVKLYGTLACKGDDLEERPHRWSKIIEFPKNLELVDRGLFEAVAAQMPKTEDIKKDKKKSGNKDFNLDAWLTKHGISVDFQAPFHDKGTKYILKTCPWNKDHTDRSAYIIRFENGAIAAGCHHNGCSEQNWSTLKQLFEGVEKDCEGDVEGNQADIIIKLVKDCQYFRSDLDEPYVAVMINEHFEVMYVKSQLFRMYVLKKYFDETGLAPNGEAMTQALKVLEMMALFSENKRQLQRRIAMYGDDYFFDLCDPEWRAVKITAKGSYIEDQPPILFTRKKNMNLQIEPDFSVKPKKLTELVKKHFRFKSSEDCVLFTVYLVSCFLPQIAHVILVLYGEKGSAKSTTMRMVKRLVDPAMHDLLAMPTSKADLAILLANTYLPAFDNIDSLSAEKSDLLCMAATGGAFTKRTLYTDSDETILRFQRCVALNGINVVTSRPDLLDRSIVLELERISKSERKTEKNIWCDFEADIPAFLGAIFNSLSAAISIREGVKLEQVGRMADFTYWGFAIAEVLEIGGDAFLASYLNNQERANQEALTSNPVAAAVMAFMRDKNMWTSCVTALLKELEEVAESEHINTRVKTWPHDPFVLSRRLKEVKSNLEEIGIFYDIRHAGDYKKITIENHNVQKIAVQTTGVDDFDQIDRNHTQYISSVAAEQASDCHYGLQKGGFRTPNLHSKKKKGAK